MSGGKNEKRDLSAPLGNQLGGGGGDIFFEKIDFSNAKEIETFCFDNCQATTISAFAPLEVLFFERTKFLKKIIHRCFKYKFLFVFFSLEADDIKF